MQLIYWTILLVCAAAEAREETGPCFEFNGQGFLEHGPYNFDLSERAHYNFTFKTTQANGILLYAHGTHDYEAVYIAGGLLTYFFFNPHPFGIGSHSGVYFSSPEPVNTNEWINVEVVRNSKLPQQHEYSGQPAPLEQTGMIIRRPREERFLHSGHIDGVNIVPPVYFGGTEKLQSQTIGNFVGQIKDIHEYVNNQVVADPTRTVSVMRCLGSDIS